MVESDSSPAIEILKSQRIHTSHPNPLVRSIAEIEKKRWRVLFTHTYREGNRAADWLSKASLRHGLGASPPQGTHSFILLTIFDLEPHNPISGLLGLFIFINPLLRHSSRLRRRACHRRHIFLPRILRLGTPFKVLWTIVKGPDLNIGAVCGELILEG
ncbi:hypothetical protein PIB30_050508 [Stylosanthes scabra]|uniref:RNase H type-1 domain-containing protein n=1 Tax=Stylosanthes scabra TaxID=79078 RepID=A0ABU6SHH4_9FABA|nr:hypothetical protein [Stylosanthes scabra]